MTFATALALKETKQSPYVNNGVNMTIYVVPKKLNDFDKFFEYYMLNKITDNTAKIFSTDGQYAIYGLGPRSTYAFWEKLS